MADHAEEMQDRLDDLRDENERVEAQAKEHGTIPEDRDEREPSLVDPNPGGPDAPAGQEEDESPESYRAPRVGSLAGVRRLGWSWPWALVAVTVVVWTFRLGTIWDDEGASTGSKLSRTALAVSFTLLAGFLAWVLARRPDWVRGAVASLGAWTAAVWVVRLAGIATADHAASFVAVHVVLAVVSVGVAALAWRDVSGSRRAVVASTR